MYLSESSESSLKYKMQWLNGGKYNELTQDTVKQFEVYEYQCFYEYGNTTPQIDKISTGLSILTEPVSSTSKYLKLIGFQLPHPRNNLKFFFMVQATEGKSSSYSNNDKGYTFDVNSHSTLIGYQGEFLILSPTKATGSSQLSLYGTVNSSGNLRTFSGATLSSPDYYVDTRAIFVY